MPCTQTFSGIARDCEPSMGGVKRVLLTNAADIATKTLTDNRVSAVTMSGAAKFHEYLFKPETANFASTYQVNRTNGTLYVQTLLQMAFSRMDTAKRVEIVAIAAAETVAIVEDMNGKYWFLGWDAPLEINAGDGGTGTARADRNGYGVTLEDDSLELPYEVDAAIVDALL